MSIRIEDGLGSGRSVGVNGDNRLETDSVSTSILAERARRGEAFVIYELYTIQDDGVLEKLVILKNNSSTKTIKIHRIDTAISDGYEEVTTVFFAFDSVYVSGGTECNKLNLNRTSGKSSEVSAYGNSSYDLVYTPDPTKVFMRLSLNKQTSTSEFYPNGSIVLGPNSSLSACAKGPSGQVLSISMFYTERVE